MTPLPKFSVIETDFDTVLDCDGQIVILMPGDAKLDAVARRINKATKGALGRFLGSKGFDDLALGKVLSLAYPTGLNAKSVAVAKINGNASVADARSCGVEIAKTAKCENILLAGGKFKRIADLVEGMAMRNYEYLDQKTNTKPKPLDVRVMVQELENQAAEIDLKMAVVDGVFFTRDLINAPSNVLTTTTFAKQLSALSKLASRLKFWMNLRWKNWACARYFAWAKALTARQKWL